MKQWWNRLWGSVHSSPGQADDFLTSPGETEKAPTGGPGKPWYKRAALWLREHDGGFTPVLEDRTAFDVELKDVGILHTPMGYSVDLNFLDEIKPDPLAERRRVAEELLKKLQ